MPFVVFVHSGGWKPEEVERAGLTGAEEVLTYLARELARIGYRVAVVLVGDAGQDRILDGVRYVGAGYLAEHWKNDPLGENTTLVVSMYPNFILDPLVSKLRASRRIFWAHSIRFDDVARKTWPLFDDIVCATDWQRFTLGARYIRGDVLPRGVTIPYGIVTPPPLPKVPGKCLYASSPDRGLLRLLRWWPEIKAECPDLTLYVAYGRERMKERAKVDHAFAAEVAEIESLIGQPGVVDLGFQTKPEMDRHIAESELWLYPTDFEETGCLIGRKAVAAGAFPIYIEQGCLREVLEPFMPVGKGFRDDMEKHKPAFVGAVCTLAKSPHFARILDPGSTWPESAAVWDRLLTPNP